MDKQSFSSSTLHDFEMGSKDENPILFHEMQIEENSDPPTTPACEGQILPLFETITMNDLAILSQKLSFS